MKYIHLYLKKKVLSANERSVFLLLEAMRLNDKGTMNSFKTTAKTHATMDEKLQFPSMSNIYVFFSQDVVGA